MQSSPLQPNSAAPLTTSTKPRPKTDERRSAGIGNIGSVTSEMGVREMDDHMSRTKKKNFDLKFELFHRRQRVKSIEDKIGRNEITRKLAIRNFNKSTKNSCKS